MNNVHQSIAHSPASEHKNVLYVFRSSILSRRSETESESESGATHPREFLWASDQIESDRLNIVTVNAPRAQKRNLIRLLFWMPDRLFSSLLGLGLPLEILVLFRKQLRRADLIMATNDQVSLALLVAKRLGLIRHVSVYAVFMSLPERVLKFSPPSWLLAILKTSIAQATAVVTLSNTLKEGLGHICDTPMEKIRVIDFPVDTEFWTPSEDPNSESFVFSIGNDMNRDFRILAETIPSNLKLKLLSRHGLVSSTPRVEAIRGWLPDSQVRALYRGAIFTVIPSVSLTWEASGLSTALQALACGSPVVVPDNPSLVEILSGCPAVFFYKAEDPHDLSAVLETVVGICLGSRALAKEARRFAVQWRSIANLGVQLSRLFENAGLRE